MKINNFTYIFLAAYLATFLRLTINNNFFISIIGSFLVGFFISRRLSYATEKILLSGFFSCFTSFSGFIYFLYIILNQGDWIKFIILLGSTFGVILRILIQNNFKKSIGFDIQNTSIVNFLSSFLLGVLVALNFMNNEILVLFYGGFLGCFSTFSSFIYQLFDLFKKRKFLRLFFHYIEVIIFSFLFFYLGYFIIQFFLK